MKQTSRRLGAKSASAARRKAERAACDIAVIGGGPAGLAFAAAMRGFNARVCLVEKQGEAAMASPEFDGRDIALTHSSMDILRALGFMPHIPQREIAPIREAHVLNGASPYVLGFDSRDEGKDALGYLISNHVIRKAAYETVRGQKNLDVRAGVEVTGIEQGAAANIARLSDGSSLEAKLIVAADSRFSSARRMMGIPTAMRDFGRTVVVCRVKHDKPHRQTAYECFHYGRTLAVLPLNGNVSSIVITLPSDQVAALIAMPEKDFARDVAERFGDRLGGMALVGKRHAYPLVATYADRFHGPRFALLGDAAVGMHPVTAHGYNFGLYGVRALAKEIGEALELGLDIGDAGMLERFSCAHRRATRPIYLGTNTLVGLFTDERPAAKFARAAMLRLGNIAKPAKTAITRQLTQTKLAG